mgnify:CR=1 FL=1|tara:strand:- start:9507 stop:11603 length:2097 start_codon:yes stop_codon:yes gene_type:complete
MPRGKEKEEKDPYKSGIDSTQKIKTNIKDINKLFVEMGDKIKTAIGDAIDAQKGFKEQVQDIGQVYQKDIVSSIKSSIASTSKQADLLRRINAGEDVRKKINQELATIAAKKLIIEKKIDAATGETKKELIASKDELFKQLDVQTDIFKGLKDQNKEKIRSISLISSITGGLADQANKLDKTGKLSALLKGNISELSAQDFGEAGQAIFIKFLVDGISLLSKLQTQFNKDLGLSNQEALKLRGQMGQVALEMKNVSINSKDIQVAFMALNEQFGTASTVLRKDIVGEMAKLGKLTGMSAESQGRFASSMMRSGVAAETVVKQSRRAVISAEDEHGVRLNINKTLEEAGKITGMIAANLGYNITAISGALAKAKQFGMTLQGLADISKNMLDFQSSIDAELQAELFIGRDLNLERARLAALTGDYATLAEEIKDNAGGELAFAQMNVLEKEKLAAALGMSADRMSDMLYDQANLAELAQEARNMGDDELADMLEKRDMQQQFNDLIEKVQMTFVDIANGPLGTIANLMLGLLDHGFIFYGLMTLIAAVKIGGLINGIISLATQLAGAGAAASWVGSALTLGLGAVAVAGGVALIYQAYKAIFGKSKSDTKTQKFQTGGTIETTGMAEVHAGETIIPAKGSHNFGEVIAGINNLNPFNNKKVDELIDVTKQQTQMVSKKDKVGFDKWGFQKVKTDYTLYP